MLLCRLVHKNFIPDAQANINKSKLSKEEKDIEFKDFKYQDLKFDKDALNLLNNPQNNLEVCFLFNVFDASNQIKNLKNYGEGNMIFHLK